MAAMSLSSALQSVLRSASRAANIHGRSCHSGFSRMNVFKDEALAPKEMDDKDYPEWLWRIQEPQPTKEELLRKAELLFARAGFDEVFDHMPERELKRLFRLEQRDRIRSENARRRGGNVV